MGVINTLLGRPEPQIKIAELLRIQQGQCQGDYLVVTRREWAKLDGETEKRWTYAGGIFGIQGTVLVFKTGGSSFTERQLESVG